MANLGVSFQSSRLRLDDKMVCLLSDYCNSSGEEVELTQTLALLTKIQ